jgi:hypothetical protein
VHRCDFGRYFLVLRRHFYFIAQTHWNNITTLVGVPFNMDISDPCHFCEASNLFQPRFNSTCCLLLFSIDDECDGGGADNERRIEQSKRLITETPHTLTLERAVIKSS